MIFKFFGGVSRPVVDGVSTCAVGLFRLLFALVYAKKLVGAITLYRGWYFELSPLAIEVGIGDGDGEGEGEGEGGGDCVGRGEGEGEGDREEDREGDRLCDREGNGDVDSCEWGIGVVEGVGAGVGVVGDGSVGIPFPIPSFEPLIHPSSVLSF